MLLAGMALIWLTVLLVTAAVRAGDEEAPAVPDSHVGIGAGIMNATTENLDGGDLRLTDDQRALIYGEGGRRPFGGAYTYANMWDNAVVPYTFRSGAVIPDFWASTRSEIESAMRVIEADTCIKFVPRTNEPHWIRIQDDGSGCNSYMGNIRKTDGQPLNLKNNGCLQFGTYLHELGHALGMLHEHQLPTRDNHVFYYKENVDPNNESQLRKYAAYMANLYDTGYDLSSVMHYELVSFSKDRSSPTLGVANTFWEEHIGRRYSHMLSFGDVRVLNKMYKCANHCGAKKCEGHGFLDKNCNCVTPDSYYSKYCKDDPAQVAWCEKKAQRGQCVRSDDYMQTHCTKTCDFCPKFLPGDSGLTKPENTCVNQYSIEENCEKWAKAGVCSDYPNWMQRHCRKSCDKYVQSCRKPIGECANRLSDDDCEGYAHSIFWSYCTSPKDWGVKARRECPDSCKVCPK